MEDRLFNLFKAVSSGMDHRQRGQIIDAIERLSNKTLVDLLVPFKDIVDELTKLTEAYRKRDWQDIDGDKPEQVREFREQYLRLHRNIIDYFTRVGYSNFSVDELNKYDSIQGRILLENDLTERRRKIQRMWDFYHQVAALPAQIKLLPQFNLQGAKEYGGALVLKRTDQSGEVGEELMRQFLSEGDDNREYLHAKFFLAELFKEQQPARIEALTRDINFFERSFTKANDLERHALTTFKRNQDPTYCSQNYQIAYNEWCLDRFRSLLRT